jgi:hypothetical protein
MYNKEYYKSKAKDKIESTYHTVRGYLDSAAEWASENSDMLIAIIPPAIGMLAYGAKRAAKLHDIKSAERLRNRMIYDRSLGMYWETRRPLSGNQKLIIEERHRAGESYGKILSDMRLLKK